VIRDTLIAALRRALETHEVDPLPETISLERPARREHGDWSSNVALASGKRAGWNPRELAGQLAETLDADRPPHVESVEIAGPGFINFRLADSWLHELLVEVVEQGVDDYGRVDLGQGRRVNVEFVSANPTGPLHAGHGRNAAYGDSLARVLDRCGFDVRSCSPSRSRLVATAGRSPRAGTTASTSSSGLPRCPPTPTPSSGATPGPSKTIATPSTA
jgi:arginyl-tRNA synthetase